MAGQRIDIMELRSLISLKLKGLSNRKVADFLKVNRKTVDSYTSRFKALNLSYQELIELGEADLRDLFTENSQTEKARYEILSSQFPAIQKELHKPGGTLQELWKDYFEKNPKGYKYTQFALHYRNWKSRSHHSGKLIHKAGEKLFVDFCGKKPYYVDKSTGEQIDVEVFIAVLPCSQYTFVKAVPSQKREDLISCMESCLRWMGGVPQAIVSDNLKSAVSKGSKYAPVINKTFADFTLHYGCVVDPARPHHPQDKALVERSVELVYQKAIEELLEEYNDYLFSHGGGSRRSYFIDLEQQYLQGIATDSYSIRQYRRAKVQKTAHVYMSEDRNYYSVPYRFTGMHVEVQYNQDKVEIFYNYDRIASHERNYKAGNYTTIPQHMPSSHQAYGQWSPEYFQGRARQVGPFTLAYIQRLFTQYNYPEIAYKQSQGILAFGKTYNNERLEKACKRGLEYHKASYRTIEMILKNNLDMEQEDPAEPSGSPIPEHSNIRGASHYQ
ncbi:IS21 family transposase [Solitalea lacus]|uniref:IS21 family transposase n=1 Tax=Solitalea lacus TaxID=2911172 RepID=UPI001EDC7AFD|nr:IS21 family transposase [Solitalea lacus]UKJ06193.1 IS21 family transposase [Solitalea lacus]